MISFSHGLCILLINKDIAYKDYYAFLNALRDSGKTKMYGAAAFLLKEYPMLTESFSDLRWRYRTGIDTSTGKRILKRLCSTPNERQIQDGYGWDLITEKQYTRYLDLFHKGQEALENVPPTPKVLALHILHRIIRDIDANRCELEFFALSPKEQAAERVRAEKAQKEWKEKIAEIKRRRGIIETDANPEKRLWCRCT